MKQELQHRRENIIGVLPFGEAELPVRYIAVWGNGEYTPWYVAKDVAKLLKYSRLDNMYAIIDERDMIEINPQEINESDCYVNILPTAKQLRFRQITETYENVEIPTTDVCSTDLGSQHSESQMQLFEPNPKVFRMVMLNSSGLITAFMRSKLPEAKVLRHWLISEVIISLSRDGYYVMPEKEGNDDTDALDRMEKLIEEKRYERKLKSGIKYPEYFERTQGFTKWRAEIIKGLSEISKSEGLDGNIMTALKLIDDEINKHQHMRLSTETYFFNQHQLEQIRMNHGAPTDMDKEIFRDDAIDPLYVIYDNPKVRRVYNDYVIDRRYYLMKDVPPLYEETFKEKVFW